MSVITNKSRFQQSKQLTAFINKHFKEGDGFYEEIVEFLNKTAPEDALDSSFVDSEVYDDLDLLLTAFINELILLQQLMQRLKYLAKTNQVEARKRAFMLLMNRLRLMNTRLPGLVELIRQFYVEYNKRPF